MRAPAPRRRSTSAVAARWGAAAVLVSLCAAWLGALPRLPIGALREVSSLSPPPGPAAMSSDVIFGAGRPRGVVLLAGDGTTWTWDPDPSAMGWTERLTAQSGPGARSGAVMAFDGSEVILFGGRRGGVSLGDTWRWDGVQWQQLTPTGSPPPRDGAAAAYIGTGLLLFGGASVPCGGCAAAVLGDTWEFTGGAWTPQPSGGPQPRVGAALTSSPTGSDVLLFGGHDALGNPLGDAWSYGSSWAPLSITAAISLPSARSRSAMASDGCKDILFSGADGAPDDTWKDLTQRVSDPSPPPARSAAGAAYAEVVLPDATVLGSMVLFGGTGPGGAALDDTWTFGDPGGTCTAEAWTLRDAGSSTTTSSSSSSSAPTPTPSRRYSGPVPSPPDPPLFPGGTSTSGGAGAGASSAGAGGRRGGPLPPRSALAAPLTTLASALGDFLGGAPPPAALPSPGAPASVASPSAAPGQTDDGRAPAAGPVEDSSGGGIGHLLLVVFIVASAGANLVLAWALTPRLHRLPPGLGDLLPRLRHLVPRLGRADDY